jgi:broad specificity phosphatase PhoE
MNNIKTIKMVREIRDRQYEEIKGKTPEELMKYYKKHYGWALAEQKAKQLQKA